MNNRNRFTPLLLAALLLGTLFLAPRPVQAAPHPVTAQTGGTELVPGHYRGWFFLEANLTTHQAASIGGATIDFNVRSKWKDEGTVNVVVTGKEAASATIKPDKFVMSISDNNLFGGGSQTCSWYSIVRARGTWAPQEGSYNKEDEDFAIPIQFVGIYSHDHTEGSVGGSIQGCDSRAKPRAIGAMMLAMDKTSEALITGLDLMVYEVGMDGSMSGSCLIPGFDVELDIPNGHTSRFSACNWAAFPVDEGKKGWWQQ